MNGITTEGYTANAMYDNIRGYGYGASSSFANPTANAVRINSGNRAAAVGFENLLDQNQFESTNKNIVDGCNRTNDAIINGEFRVADRLRDIEREMNANARAADKCCCDLKLQSCEDKAEILAAVADSKATALAVEGRAVERSLNAANAELTALKTQIACGCCSSPSA